MKLPINDSTSILDYFHEDHFADRPLTKKTSWVIRRLNATLTEFLGREPLLGDITAELLASFETWLQPRVGRHQHYQLTRTLRAAARRTGRAASPPNRRPKGRVAPPPLSTAKGTLWAICLERYFAESVAITSDDTRRHYERSVRRLREVVGREPQPRDLTEDNINKLSRMLLDRGLAPSTVNGERKKLRALWEWLARRRIVREFPAIRPLKAPRQTPKAWTREQLASLLASCQREPGNVVWGISAADWWTALHLVLWSTGERIGAILACRWDWLNLETGKLEVPYHVRKGRDCDFVHWVRPEALEILRRMKPAGYKLIFPWPRHEATFYYRYSRILKRAGLPTGRKSKTHRMRRSVASHLVALGHNATEALGHSDPKVTRDSYLDPGIIGRESPATLLPSIVPVREGAVESGGAPATSTEVDALAWL